MRRGADETARMFGGKADEIDGQHEKVLLRVFVHFHGKKVVLLLGGNDRGDDPKKRRQQREVTEARRLLGQFRERQRKGRQR